MRSALAAVFALAAATATFQSAVAEQRYEDLQGRITRLSDSFRKGKAAVLVLPARMRSDCKAYAHCLSPDIPVAVLFAAGQDRAQLIDTGEKVRREFKETAVDAIFAAAASWVRGMRSYEAQCARCHGLDGADTSYPNIKPLAGIGQRYGIDEIAVKMTSTGNTDLTSFNEDAKRALAGYVATL